MRLIRTHPLLAAAGLLALVVVSVIAWAGITVWVEAHHDDASDVERADTIVVLGAAQYNGDPSPVLRGRLDHALLLWQQDRADVVLTVGSNQPGDSSTEAEAGRQYLIDHGVPSDAVVALPVGHTTFESLQAVSGWLHDRELSSAFLVSDPWHNARLHAMADDLGMVGYTSATWTSGAQSEESRGRGYARETFAYLHYIFLGD